MFHMYQFTSLSRQANYNAACPYFTRYKETYTVYRILANEKDSLYYSLIIVISGLKSQMPKL